MREGCNKRKAELIETLRTDPRQKRERNTAPGGTLTGRNQQGHPPPERPSSQNKKGPRGRKKINRPSQKRKSLPAGPSKYPRIRRTSAEVKPQSSTQVVEPPCTSLNSGKPQYRQQVQGQLSRETARGEWRTRGQRVTTRPPTGRRQQEHHPSPGYSRQSTLSRPAYSEGTSGPRHQPNPAGAHIFLSPSTPAGRRAGPRDRRHRDDAPPPKGRQ